ncbi:sigma-54 interaction domain-containing protein [Desulfolutivibrio sulfoxidireducens]|uniref:sigma-54 interaction domain-containing protein n=1 Tax=Desulfolutivibrio sulfoxidireducens TaxID=2773299 RepID=UPI00159DB151|nr:sigma 54-interacting transcriptional regulator [Desulfolutivibrio sulfoxidireducens]QLA15477.1 PAS domain S-box protein [Desulfolutivibrio sulfoxidireducens]
MQFPKNIPCQAIMESLADGVFTVDTDWTVTFFNRAAGEIIGIAPEEAVGRKCWDVFHSSICDGACALRESMATGQPLPNSSIFIVRPDGEKIPVSISAAPLRDAKGRIVGGVETFRDISEIQRMRNELKGIATLDDIVTKSHLMSRILSMLPKIAASGSTVLILGESGTGKELFARAIHNHSPRRDGPFVAVNCGAIPGELLESELFGHAKGAFTDAKTARKGRFATAQGGTIFLDEIGDMPLSLQVKLLRVLQEKVFEPLGSDQAQQADARVVAATNRDLEAMVAEGTFRRDLFYRLGVVRLVLPPLRERPEDIALLTAHFIERLNAVQGKNVLGAGRDVMRVLLRHDFPGNVRELQNILEYAFILCASGHIGLEHLPDYLLPRGQTRAATEKAPAPPTMRAAKYAAATEALARHDGRKMAACRELDITKDTLRRILEQGPGTNNSSIPSSDDEKFAHNSCPGISDTE